MPKVKCSVANCNYWATGNNCDADLIMIDTDQHSDIKYDEEYADENFGSAHKDEVAYASETCCHTFKSR